MAHSHTCTRCGLDLAHTPVRVELRYAWAMVVCPRCNAPAVRTRHAVTREFRRARKRAKALLGLLGRLALLGAITPSTLLHTFDIATSALALRASSWLPAPLVVLGLDRAPDALLARDHWLGTGEARYLLVAGLVGAAMNAVFLRVLLRHIPAWASSLGWTAWLLLWAALVSVVIPGLERLVHAGSAAALPAASLGLSNFQIQAPWIIATGAATFALSPLGTIAARSARSLVRRQRRSMKRSRRARRQSA